MFERLAILLSLYLVTDILASLHYLANLIIGPVKKRNNDFGHCHFVNWITNLAVVYLLNGCIVRAGIEYG
jgi:hypothetical protein